MKRQHQISTRNLGSASPTAIVGAVLLVIGLLVVAPQAWACFCKCYWSTDCADGEYCNYSGCTHQTVDNKLKDGLCKKRASVEPTTQEPAAQALDLWLRAFEDAGANGGGEPNAELLAELQGLGLSDQLHADIREVALAILGQTVGYTSFPDAMHSNPGFFSAPLFVVIAEPQPCETYPTEIDNGVIAPLDDTLLGVTARVRQAVVAELRTPGMGILEAKLAGIEEDYPNFVTTGNCELPSLRSERSPFNQGIQCLTSELQLMVHSVLANPPAPRALPVRHIGLAP
jgi:hypothetical protein